jgi:hypothetical protein
MLAQGHHSRLRQIQLVARGHHPDVALFLFTDRLSLSLTAIHSVGSAGKIKNPAYTR